MNSTFKHIFFSAFSGIIGLAFTRNLGPNLELIGIPLGALIGYVSYDFRTTLRPRLST